MRAPSAWFCDKPILDTDKFLGMSYCIIAVNVYDVVVSTKFAYHIVTVRSLEEI